MDDEFSTAEFVRELDGEFRSNLGTPAGASRNARIGTFLSRNGAEPGIEIKEDGVDIKDDVEHPTTTAVWQ